MSNEEILERLKADIKLRGLSQNTFEEYVGRVTMFMCLISIALSISLVSLKSGSFCYT